MELQAYRKLFSSDLNYRLHLLPRTVSASSLAAPGCAALSKALPEDDGH